MLLSKYLAADLLGLALVGPNAAFGYGCCCCRGVPKPRQ